MSKAITLPFSFDSNGGISSTEDMKKIIQDRVVLVLMTYASERIMRPAYGTLVRGSSFENQAEAINMINREIDTGFNTWLPYLTLLTVNSSIDPADGHLNIEITYKYGSSANPETIIVKTDILNQSGDVITEVSYGR